MVEEDEGVEVEVEVAPTVRRGRPGDEGPDRPPAVVAASLGTGRPKTMMMTGPLSS